MVQSIQKLTFAQLSVEYIPPSDLTRNPRNARKHPQAQIVKLKAGIAEFGFVVPILIDEQMRVIAGHGRLLAADQLNLETVPCVRVEHLSDAQKRALALADNRLGELSSWDDGLVIEALAGLEGLDFNLDLTGFDTAEIDVLFDTAGAEKIDPADAGAEPDPSLPQVTRPGDLWELGAHRLICADALSVSSYEQLLGDRLAELVFCDMPYNVPINGHVSGLGKASHSEFAMASGEMSKEQFTAFLTTALSNMARFSTDGSIHFQCMDWRHMGEMLAAGAVAYSELKGLCFWNKTNAGMGSLYRSKHELVFVFKNGTASHVNNVQLGKFGRWRSNVWDYPGANSFRRGRDADLADHPTVKPTALVADAIRDCSKRGALVLDPFAGSGTIILAAERTGRRAAAMEIDPLFVDTAIRRWQTVTGKSAVLSGDGRIFAEIQATRNAPEAALAQGANHD